MTVQESHTAGNSEHSIFDILGRCKDFLEFNRILGLPSKPGMPDMPIYDYELKVLNELLRLDGTPKDKHVCWLKSRVLGCSWCMLRIMTYLGLDELAGTQMAIVTGNRVELSVSLISTIKSWFTRNHGYLFGTKETVVQFPNGTTITGYPGRIDAMRGQSFSFVMADEFAFFEKSQQDSVIDVITGFIQKGDPYLVLLSTGNEPMDGMDKIMQEDESETIWHRLKMDYTSNAIKETLAIFIALCKFISAAMSGVEIHCCIAGAIAASRVLKRGQIFWAF